MKRFIALTFLFSILLIPCVAAQPVFTVRTIYFQPTDAPAAQIGRIIELLIESQDFYRSEMERHGYGAKTFRLETDGAGNVGFHQIRGKHNAAHYLDDTYTRVAQELPFKFTLDPLAEDNVHVILMGGLNRLDNGNVGYAWYHARGKAGGVAVIAGEALHFRLIAHEIGHTFGLQHTGVQGALMGAWEDILLDYETHWLDRHHLFNEAHRRNNLPQFVESLPIEALENDRVRFTVVAESEIGLYHVQIYRKRLSFVIGAVMLDGQNKTIKIDGNRNLLINGDHISVQIMDIHGNNMLKKIANITLPEPIPDPIAAEPKIVDKPEVVIEPIDCPTCDPPDTEPDLAIQPQRLLTSQWAILKQR